MNNAINRLKELETSLCKLDEERRFLLDAVDAGVWSWNLETDELTWNDRMFSLFDKSKDAFTGTVSFFFDCLHPCERERVGIEVQRALAENSHFVSKYTILVGDKSKRVILAFGRSDDKYMRGICLPYPKGETIC
jgi:PAS domain-containing protein